MGKIGLTLSLPEYNIVCPKFCPSITHKSISDQSITNDPSMSMNIDI